jgi:AcrR family transcriptional regulator
MKSMAYRSEVRTARKQDTRRALIEAAVRLFLEHGTEAPSLAAICEEAGCTRGAFYVHFKTREELIVAAMERSLGDFMNRILATNAANDDAGFVDAFLAAITTGSPHVGAASLRFHHLLDACARYPAIRQRYLTIVDATQETIRARLAARKVPDPAARASVIAAIAMGLLAHVDLERPIEPAGVRKVVRELLRTRAP